MAGLDDLLPRARSPVDYLNVVTDPRPDQDGLRALATSPYPFVRHAVAACPRADSATLAAVVTEDLNRWTRHSVLAAIARHPNADRSVLLTILGRTRALLDWPAAVLGRHKASEHDAYGLPPVGLQSNGVTRARSHSRPSHHRCRRRGVTPALRPRRAAGTPPSEIFLS